jgi:hypothetical protein
VLLGHLGPFLPSWSARAKALTGGEHQTRLARVLAGFNPSTLTVGAAALDVVAVELGGVVLTYAALPAQHPAAACRRDLATAIARRRLAVSQPAAVGLSRSTPAGIWPGCPTPTRRSPSRPARCPNCGKHDETPAPNAERPEPAS